MHHENIRWIYYTNYLDDEKPVEKEEIVILGDKNSWLDTHKVSTSKNEGYKWAVQENRDMSDFHELVPEMAIEYPFEMDFFQKEAVFHIEQGGTNLLRLCFN